MRRRAPTAVGPTVSTSPSRHCHGWAAQHPSEFPRDETYRDTSHSTMWSTTHADAQIAATPPYSHGPYRVTILHLQAAAVARPRSWQAAVRFSDHLRPNGRSSAVRPNATGAVARPWPLTPETTPDGAARCGLRQSETSIRGTAKKEAFGASGSSRSRQPTSPSDRGYAFIRRSRPSCRGFRASPSGGPAGARSGGQAGSGRSGGHRR
jgi:hypothetical protein